MWPHHAYGKNAIVGDGHHGNAILSKHPFVHWENYDISRWWFSQRGILMGKMDNNVYVLCCHFGLISLERRYQLRHLLELVTHHIPLQSPVIIAGDFNDWRLKLDKKLKWEGFREAHSEVGNRPARTFPAAAPLLHMDRIYYKNLKLVDAEVMRDSPWNKLSDHCALTASFVTH